MPDMTPSEREAFYDAEISPALLKMSKDCQERGLSFLAVVEWDPGETERTVVILANSGIGIRIAEMAARAHGNVDGLIIGLMRYAQEHGHNSMCLERLGVPARPLRKTEESTSG